MASHAGSVNSSNASATALSPLLLLCFTVSGMAALIYQTAWTRQFALVFGTSELAVATVLAAYMAGLALGAWASRWLLRFIHRPVWVYGALELGIGASAIVLVPASLWASDLLLQSLFGGQGAPPSSEQLGLSMFYLAAAFIALLLPTALMGATLPLLARHAVHRDEDVAGRISLLYACNTAGAVAGALLAAFALLPNLGLRRTVWVAAALNILVFILALLLSRGSAANAALAPPPTKANAPAAPAPGPPWILPLMLAAGACSFLHEVLWTRMLSHIIGSSIYAFGVMVASFLAGIALGGAAGAWLARSRRQAGVVLAAAFAACAAWAPVAFWLIEHAAPGTAGLLANSRINALFGFALLLPLTFAIGTTYPLAVRLFAADGDAAAVASARVYAWNTVGAIVGALAGGFWLIPALRYEGTVVLASCLSGLLAAAALAMSSGKLRTLALVPVASALALALLYRPAAPQHLLLTSPLNVSSEGRMLYYGVGRSASVVLMQQDGGLVLRTNGLPEAMMDTPGMVPRFSGEFWLAPLATLARPQMQDMMIVGYGGGVVVEAVPPSVRHIDVIELEPEVIAANRATSQLRKRNPLLDTRVNIINNDARGALSLTDRRYDAIVSQPSHPWTAGASHLYTSEFMTQARDHLRPGGVFVQWMNVAFLDEGLLRSLTATLVNVFGEVRIYRPDPNTLLFLASASPLDLEQQIAADGGALRRSPGHYARYGINSLEDLVAALNVDEAGARALAVGAPLITDDDNRMATSSVFEFSRGLTAESLGRVLAPYDPLRNPQSWIYQKWGQTLRFDYIARRLAFFRSLDSGLLDRMERIVEIQGDTPQSRYIATLLLQIRGENANARQLTQESAARYPGSQLLAYAFAQSDMRTLLAGESTPALRAATAQLPAAAQAALRGLAMLDRGQWRELSELEPLLAQAQWTDIWFMDCNQLRAEWRARIANDELRHRMGDEAIDLLDRGAMQQPSLAMFTTRVRAALTAQRPDVLLESLHNVAQWTAAYAGDPGTERRAEARETAAQMLRLLDAEAGPLGADAVRVAEIRAQLAGLQSRLN